MSEPREPGPDTAMVAGSRPAEVAAPSPTTKVDYECPGCHRTLRVRREFFGSTLICKHCGNQFVPTAQGGTPPTIALASPVPNLPDFTAVETRTRDLAGQLETLGSQVAAIDAGLIERDSRTGQIVSDLARLTADLTGVQQQLAALTDELGGVRQHASAATEDAVQAILAGIAHQLREERQHAEQQLEPLRSEVERLHHQNQELATRVQSQPSDGHEPVDHRWESFQSEVARLHQENRELADRFAGQWREEHERIEQRLASVGNEVDRLHDQHVAAADDAETNSNVSQSVDTVALATRLDALEASLPVHLEPLTHLEQRVAAWDDRHSEFDALRQRLDDQLGQGQAGLNNLRVLFEERLQQGGSTLEALREQVDKLQQGDSGLDPLRENIDKLHVQSQEVANASAARDEQVHATLAALRSDFEATSAALDEQANRRLAFDEAVARFEVAAAKSDQTETALAALRSDQEAVRTALAEQAEHRSALEAAIARIETAAEHDRRDLAARWVDFEARVTDRGREVAAVHEQLQQVGEIHSARLDQLGTYLERINTLETNTATFRRELESLQGDQGAANQDLKAQLEALRRDLAQLRLSGSGQPPVSASSPTPRIVANPIRRKPPGGPIKWTAADATTERPELESLFDALTWDRTTVGTSSVASPNSGVHPRSATSPVAPAPPSSPDIYNERRNKYYTAMQSARYADAIGEARALVELTRHVTDNPNLDHALWLRNLAISLVMSGANDEARPLLHSALDLCESDAPQAQTPRLMCLFDLTDFYLQLNDPGEALSHYGRALNLLTEVGEQPAPVQQRAQQCMDRIKAISQGNIDLAAVIPELSSSVVVSARP